MHWPTLLRDGIPFTVMVDGTSVGRTGLGAHATVLFTVMVDGTSVGRTGLGAHATGPCYGLTGQFVAIRAVPFGQLV